MAKLHTTTWFLTFVVRVFGFRSHFDFYNSLSKIYLLLDNAVLLGKIKALILSQNPIIQKILLLLGTQNSYLNKVIKMYYLH